MAPAAPQQPKPTRGTIDALPCPWCHKPNSMIEEVNQGWGGKDSEFKLDALQKDNVYQCDHCQRPFRIHDIKTVTLLYAQPVARRGG